MGVLIPRADYCEALAQALSAAGDRELALAWTSAGLALRPGDRGRGGPARARHQPGRRAAAGRRAWVALRAAAAARRADGGRSRRRSSRSPGSTLAHRGPRSRALDVAGTARPLLRRPCWRWRICRSRVWPSPPSSAGSLRDSPARPAPKPARAVSPAASRGGRRRRGALPGARAGRGRGSGGGAPRGGRGPAAADLDGEISLLEERRGAERAVGAWFCSALPRPGASSARPCGISPAIRTAPCAPGSARSCSTRSRASSGSPAIW
jgi:hypothetical protein